MSKPMNPRVEELFATIKAAHDELRAIRAACIHPSYTLAWWDWGPGRYSPSRICEVCRDHLDGITDDEREKLGPLFPPMEPPTWRPA